MPMLITKELVMLDVKALNHGGEEAITLFMEMSSRLHEVGGRDALQDWVIIAAPSLSEKERNEVLVMLMCAYLFLDSQTQAQNSSGLRSSILH
jgi:hypothetical protein